MSSTSRRLLPSGVARTRLRPRPRTVPTDTAPAATAPHSTAQTIGTLITALTAIGALVFTGLALNATRDQVAASQRQNEVAQQGQFTDRYTKAVEQLGQQGAEKLQIRLGGIYALQRLAVDSPRDQPTIVNVLITFITSTTPRASSPDGSGCPERSAPDVQAAFTVLIDRDRRHDKPDAPKERMVLSQSLPEPQRTDRHNPDFRRPDRGGPARGGPERGGPAEGGPERGGPARGGPEQRTPLRRQGRRHHH